MSELTKKSSCSDNTPPWFTGHWRDWHRGHGCDRDDGNSRSEDATTEIAQHEANKVTGYLTDAELRFLRAATTSGNEMLVHALDELATRRGDIKARALLPDPVHVMLGPPGWRCSCSTSFEDYYALAEHMRLSIDCPRCGAAPVDLGDNDLYRWRCGHWIARNDATAAIRGEGPRQC